MLRYLEINLAILRPRRGKYMEGKFQCLDDINCIKPNVCQIQICDLLVTFSGLDDLRIVKLQV